MDVLLALAPDADPDVLTLARIQEEVKTAFASLMPGIEVNVSLVDDMRTAVRANVEGEAVYAY